MLLGTGRAGDPHPSLQVLPELRAEQARRLTRTPQVLGAYFGVKWDLGETQVPSNARPLARRKVAWLLATRSFRTVELPEPMWLRELPCTAVLAAVTATRRKLTRTDTRLVFYGIENNDVRSLVGTGVLVRALRPGVLAVLRFTLRRFDRVVFGSPSSRDAYLSIEPALSSRCDVVLELLPRADVAGGGPDRDDLSCAFVGELSRRKGVAELMAAWEAVESALPSSRLELFGDGPLRPAVQTWCRQRPSQRRSHGLVEATSVPSRLSAVRLVVAPSVRWGRWREQIGLPVIEALSVGTTVVTSDETGLAEWLRARGHGVIPAEELSSRLAGEIERLLRRPLPREEVLRSLPARDQRLVAHERLHGSSDA